MLRRSASSSLAARMRSVMSATQPGDSSPSAGACSCASCSSVGGSGSADLSGSRSLSGCLRMYSSCAARASCRCCLVVSSHAFRASIDLGELSL